MGMSKSSERSLRKALEPLQHLFFEVAKKTDIIILDSIRGKAAQELAYRSGHSKVRFGQSAHNYVPALALDVCPAPIDWNSRQPFITLGKNFVLPLAKELKIPIRWGADWNMNSDLTDEKFSDLPHYELHPWRDWAKQCKLFQG